MIKINSIDEVKIYKILPWAIYFKVGNDRYMIHESSDTIYNIALYRKDVNNPRIVEYLKGISFSDISAIIPYRRHGATYKSITEEFIWRLVRYGLAIGVFEEECGWVKEKERQVHNKLLEINRQEYELAKALRELRKKGYKVYRDEQSRNAQTET